MRHILVLFGFMCAVALPGNQAFAEAEAALPSAQSILVAMDHNMLFERRTSTIKMRVEGRRRTRTFEILSYGRGQSDAAMEYLQPLRDRGTKMLKLGEDLWIYMPTIERTQKISGHMLRQGMMGSDLSYEDMMATQEMNKMYVSKVKRSEELEGRATWVLEMVAKDLSLTYPKRVMWVDKERSVALKQELYALSGLLLKVWSMSKIEKFGPHRYFPTRMVIEDKLKKGSKTILEFSYMNFDVKVPEEVFSRRWLERR
jgi:outer membrane lipoprotein-sorting protein